MRYIKHKANTALLVVNQKLFRLEQMTGLSRGALTILTFIFILCMSMTYLIMYFIVQMHQDDDAILQTVEDFQPIQASFAIGGTKSFGKNKEIAIYPGAKDKFLPSTSYNSLGLPTDRQWLHSKEWRGKHISYSNYDLRGRFKTWKKLHMQEFKDFAKNIAKDEQKVFGIPWQITVAQAILESNYGLSRVSVQGNNFFGHKCWNCDTAVVAHDDSPTDRFAVRKSKWASFRAHSKLLSGRYKDRLKKNTVDGWIEALCGGKTAEESKRFVKSGGKTYATRCHCRDKNGLDYQTKLKRVIDNL